MAAKLTERDIIHALQLANNQRVRSGDPYRSYLKPPYSPYVTAAVVAARLADDAGLIGEGRGDLLLATVTRQLNKLANEGKIARGVADHRTQKPTYATKAAYSNWEQQKRTEAERMKKVNAVTAATAKKMYKQLGLRDKFSQKRGNYMEDGVRMTVTIVVREVDTR